MKKLLLSLGLLLLIACAPLADSIQCDVHNNYPIIFNEDVMIKDTFPPQVLELDEGYIIYVGTSERTIRRKGITVIFVDDRIFTIKCKVIVPNGSKIYVEVVNKGKSDYSRYIITNGRKYMMYIESIKNEKQ